MKYLLAINASHFWNTKKDHNKLFSNHDMLFFPLNEYPGPGYKLGGKII